MPLFLISIILAYFSNAMLHGRRTLQTEAAKGKVADLFGLIQAREKRTGGVEGLAYRARVTKKNVKPLEPSKYHRDGGYDSDTKLLNIVWLFLFPIGKRE